MGVLDRQELLNVLQHIDCGVWTDDQIDAVIEAADCNCDGKIQFDEFVRWVFGNDGEVGLVQRTEKMMELALKTIKDKDVEALNGTLLRWRQAVDIGCLRVADPALCLKACDALTRLAAEFNSVVEGAAEMLGVNLELSRNLCAILDGVMELLADRARRHVVRVACGTSQKNIRALCFELADGTRLGQCPGGLSNAALEAAGVKWLELGEGEHIIEVRGWQAGSPTGDAKAKAKPSGRSSPSPRDKDGAPDDGFVGPLVLCTNQNRQVLFGGPVKGEPTFSYKAADDAQVENATFIGGTCTSIDTVPLPACWKGDVITKVHQSLQLA